MKICSEKQRAEKLKDLRAKIRQCREDIRDMEEQREYRWLACGDVALIGEEIAELENSLQFLRHRRNEIEDAQIDGK